MTFNASLLSPPIRPFQIRYVDAPRDASSVRRHRVAVAARRVAIAFVAAAAIVAAAVGFAGATDAAARSESGGQPNAAIPSLVPAQRGYVIKIDADPGLSGLQPNKVIPSLVPAPPGRVPAR